LTNSWISGIIIKTLGLDKDPPLPKPPKKMIDPPAPFVRLTLGAITLLVGPVILWITYELYQLKVLGFFMK